MARIVFFGNERLATGVSTTAPTLRRLIEAGYHIAAVVSHHTDGISRRSRELEIAAVAAEHGIPVLLPNKPAEIAEQLGAFGADVGVLVAYGRIVPESVIDIFPRGIVNIHPSLLPLHRGPTPIESVMLQGAHETGVSIMQLVAAMDAGPVYGQVALPTDRVESKQELADTLLSAGGDLLLQLLPSILDGTAAPKTQDEYGATYDQLISKDAGQLDLDKPAMQLVREIRAYAGWPQSRLQLGSTEIIITAAHALAPDAGNTAEATTGTAAASTSTIEPGRIWRSGKEFGFYTSQGVLVVDRLKPSGKAEMTAEAFRAGYAALLV